MQISANKAITHPAKRAFLALRDKQAHLAETYLPNIESLEVLERDDNPPKVRLYNRWQGSTGEVAKIIKPFISRELTCWYDEATWDEDSLSCEWRIHSAKAKDIFACSGSTALVAQDENSCLFTLSGELTVHPDKVPGIPGFLARKVREPIEKFVAGLLNPNLTMMAQAVQQYLDDEGKKDA